MWRGRSYKLQVTEPLQKELVEATLAEPTKFVLVVLRHVLGVPSSATAACPGLASPGSGVLGQSDSRFGSQQTGATTTPNAARSTIPFGSASEGLATDP